MSNKKILMDLISTYGSLSHNQNQKIIDDFFNQPKDIFKIKDFIEYYNSNTNKPINDYALSMYFRYIK